MTDHAAMFASDLAVAINDVVSLKKTMTWVNPSGTTESIEVTISPIQKSGRLDMEGVYPDFSIQAVGLLSAFASATVLPNTSDDVTIDSVVYFVQTRIADPAAVSLVLSLR